MTQPLEQVPTHLTSEEKRALTLTAQLSNTMERIIGDGPQSGNDWQECASHIHVIQHMIMSQAAARAYPEAYRLLGQDL